MKSREEHYREALETIARLTKDGEVDGEGREFEMSIDDAFETLNIVIQLARDTLAKAKEG